MWEAFAALLALAVALLKHYLANTPTRQEQARHDAAQALRQAIADGDADAVSARIDELREKHRIPSGR
ncbi:MAG: hypothetical protein PHC98_09855, partial [Syntrophotalea acetylenica]|jgi:hypothetical protein|uniref:hypothetical protein n=1 Tax=Syntrophotalea acetylenica TaxID=29542 RepID=UPI002A370B38|nr:hypothetical protein [Syntrophotalea acetylenica]MDD4457868.1 hypothetical protein [Syntrophotalea acetylenica]MDY0261994.1 hypothetical protein [Syntrophotalea acetylenica]